MDEELSPLDVLTPEQRRALGGWLARQRKLHTAQCRQCGQVLQGLATRRYCSNACRQKAKRARKQEPPP